MMQLMPSHGLCGCVKAFAVKCRENLHFINEFRVFTLTRAYAEGR